MSAEPLRVVGVSGSTSTASRTTSLVTAMVDAVASRRAADTSIVSLADLAPTLSGVLHRGHVGGDLAEALERIEGADLLVVATPVYRGAYAGLFKHLFDLIDQDALDGVPVLLAATGGSARHALVIEHQLRPLLAFFRALTLPIGVYAADDDFVGDRVVDQELLDRIDRAVESGLPLMSVRPNAVPLYA